MKLKTLTLNDFQSYDEETIDFDTGISIIYGENGAGKSTLLRGIFAALFQTSMKSELTGDINIGGLVNKQEDTGSVELTFEEGEEAYTVFWEIQVDITDEGERRGRTKSCQLISESGDLTLSGVTEVTNFITELLGIDAQAFVNSVYVQQEELTKLLTADTSTRKEIFDRLLGLQQIDAYIDRIDKARREVKSVRKDKTARKEELQNQLDEKADADELCQKRDRLQKQISDLEESIENLRDKRDKLQAEKTQIENAETNTEELKERKEELEGKIADKKTEVGSLNQEKASLKDELEEVESELDSSVDTSVDELQSELDSLQDKRSDLQDKKTDAHNAFTTKQSNLREKTSRLTSITNELNEATAERDSAQVEMLNKQASLQQKLDAQERLRDELSHIDSTLQTETDVESAIDIYEDEYSRLTENIDQLKEKLEAIRADIATEQERLKQTEQQVENKESNLELPPVFDDRSESLEEIEERLVAEVETVTADEISEDDAYELAVSILPDKQRESVIDADGERLWEAFDTVEELRQLALYYIELYEQQTTKSEIDNLKATAEDIRDSITSLQASKDRLELQVSVRESDADDVQSTLQSLRKLRDVIEERNELQSEHGELSETYDDAMEQVRTLQQEQTERMEAISELSEELETQKQESDKIDAELDEVDTQIQETQEKIQTVQKQEQLQTRKDNIESQIDNKQDILEDKIDRLTALKNEKSEVVEKLDDIDDVDRTIEDVESELSDVESSITKKESTKEDKQAELVKITGELETISELEEKINTVEQEIIGLSEKLEEVKEVKQSYLTVKEETRKKYLAKINQYTNEIFTTIYENESYERVEIDSDYRITLFTSDGTEIEPALTSGGESAIVNLALRAGVYRVITETGNGSLPPFILDEPTTFLDTQHVGKLEALARKMADWDIEQVFIVSHNEQLIESGDAVYNVIKDNNNSQVIREY